jgi:predicted site-specific integrase-resolvase
VRFGFEWLERFLKTHGVELVLIHHEKRSPEQEFVQDFFNDPCMFMPNGLIEEV